jgi:hypothetical protein
VRTGEDAGVLFELISAEQLRPQRRFVAEFPIAVARSGQRFTMDQISESPLDRHCRLLRPPTGDSSKSPCSRKKEGHFRGLLDFSYADGLVASPATTAIAAATAAATAVTAGAGSAWLGLIHGERAAVVVLAVER